jgi:NRPS condensation-like uncharacterized protein
VEQRKEAALKKPSDRARVPRRFRAVMADQIVYSQSRMYEPQIHAVITFRGRIREDRMARAVRLSLDAEPVLGCRFVNRWWRPFWERLDDLDSRTLCDVIETGDVENELHRFLTSPADPCEGPQVLARILRAGNDTLCVKLSHLASDAGGTKEYLYLLASLYRKLAGEPGFGPCPNQKGNRSFCQVSGRFGFWDLLRILGCGVRDWIEDSFPAGSWAFPSAAGLPVERAFVLLRIGPERFRALQAFGARHRATVNDVVVAALYHALCQRLRPSAGLPLRLLSTADLRRHLPSGKAGAICNLSGFVHLNPGREPVTVLEDTTVRVRDLMNRKKASYIGLGDYPFAALFFKGLPFSWSRKLLHRATDRYIRSGKVVPAITNLGVVRQQELVFGGPEVTDAFLAAPVIYPPMFAMGVSGFRESLTFSIGFCETGLDRLEAASFLELVDACLPGDPGPG